MRLRSLFVLLLTACSGITARQEALLPAMRLAWANVAEDVQLGIASGLATARLTQPQAAQLVERKALMTDGLASGDPLMVDNAMWSAMLKPEALEGIETRKARGEVSEGVAVSLRERVAQFDDSVIKFLERR